MSSLIRINSKGYQLQRAVAFDENNRRLSILYVRDYQSYIEFLCDCVYPQSVARQLQSIRTSSYVFSWDPHFMMGRICEFMSCEKVHIQQVTDDNDDDVDRKMAIFDSMLTSSSPRDIMRQNHQKGLFPDDAYDAFVSAAFLSGFTDDEIVYNMAENYRRNHMDPFNPFPPPDER